MDNGLKTALAKENTLLMNDGNRIPRLGMGVYLVPDGELCVESIKMGLRMGYRLIDTAAAYENERSVGRGMRESDVSREEIFLTTKLWVQDYGFESAKKAIDRRLERLGVDYIDMILLHRPAGDNAGAYRALEQAQREGKIRSIGVCNHTPLQLKALMEQTSVIPAVNQMECHPLQQQKDLRALLRPNRILLESWFPLGHGSKRLHFNDQIKTISNKYGKSISQIILRWHIQEGFVVIPKSSNPEHQRENLEIFNFTLEETDMETIRGLDANRYLGGDPEDPEKFKAWLETRFDT